MWRATTVVPATEWKGDQSIDAITLDYDHRCRRRIALTTDDGNPIVIDLSRAAAIHDGDALRLESGELIVVHAAPEQLTEISVVGSHAAARIAWHLGNRHLPVQFAGDCIRIRRDHVIEAMLIKLGADLRAIDAPFDPEGGAYGEGQVHGHEH